MKRLLLFAACAMLTVMPSWGVADDAAPPSPAKAASAIVDAPAVAPTPKIELNVLRVVNGRASLCVETRCYGAVSLKDLAPNIAIVAKQFPDATYATDGRTLVVGITERGKPANATLIEIAWQSDCPNNSQFQAQREPAQIAKVRRPQLRDALVAWTRWRHDSPQATLQRLHQNNSRHWDVQLDIKKNLVSLR